MTGMTVGGHGEMLVFKAFSNAVTSLTFSGQKAPFLREIRGVVAALLRFAHKPANSVTGMDKA
jgi:hypothetical protein